tara:strand:+ start:723 stop:872 length:150 start_codon:yes stop_codon:yes gene_type:complete
MEEMEMTKGNSTSTIRKLNYANSDLEMKNGSGSGMTGGDTKTSNYKTNA